LLLLIGFTTGSTAFFIDAVVKYIVMAKFWAVDLILDTSSTSNGRENFGMALVVWIGISMFLCSIAAILVCFVESAAAGSGIPEIKCRLNGIRMKRVLRIKTYFTKVFGVLFSVAGGLPVGKEGPMIHSGAILGSGVNQLKSTTVGLDAISGRSHSKLRSFRNDIDKRDMIAAGASAGVAAAFGAPIGGVLFALEEGCSFWNVKLTWGNFFAAMVSTTTINLFMTGINTEVPFGLLTAPGMVTFGRFASTEATAFNVWEIPYFIMVGCGGGLLGAGFNHLNTLFTQFRLKKINARPWRRFAEVMLVAFVVAVFAIAFPYFADDCTDVANSKNSNIDQTTGRYVPLDLPNRKACYTDDCKCSPALRGALIAESEENQWQYDCLYDPSLDESIVQFACKDKQYSPAASLSFAKGDVVIKGLLHNPQKTPMLTLTVFLCFYWFLACWTYGIGVPSGLFVPSLITGAAYGRLVGQLLDEAGMLSSDYDAVGDRVGVYALVGASAMLAGMARITISLTVILIECTNDVQYALPIMLCVMFAKWVADLFNHGLYDIHIHLKQVPLLEPFSEKEMYAIQAKHVMSRRVEALPQVATLQKVIESLTETQHSTFPIVTTDEDMLYLGMVRRDFLCGLLQKAGPRMLQKTYDEASPPLESWDIIQDMFPSYPSIKEATAWATEEHRKMYINLLPYANTNAYTVRSNACMRRVYTLFRGMGLRCLPVLKLGTNEVEGLITRQDLSHVNVHEALAVAQSEPGFIGANASMGRSHTESFKDDASRASFGVDAQASML